MSSSAKAFALRASFSRAELTPEEIDRVAGGDGCNAQHPNFSVNPTWTQSGGGDTEFACNDV